MTVAQLTCRHCSAAIEQTDRFCWDCGIRVEQGSRRLVSPLLEDRRKDAETNPLMKAEIVLTCALTAFLVSAIVWANTSMQQSRSNNAQAQGPAVVAPQPGFESEFDRLMHQAKTTAKSPKTTLVPEIANPIRVKKETVTEPIKETVADPIQETSFKQDTIKPIEPKTVPISGSRTKASANVAEYNRLLAAYFSNKNTATADGAAAEPPTFQEWLKSGKPNF